MFPGSLVARKTHAQPQRCTPEQQLAELLNGDGAMLRLISPGMAMICKWVPGPGANGHARPVVLDGAPANSRSI